MSIASWNIIPSNIFLSRLVRMSLKSNMIGLVSLLGLSALTSAQVFSGQGQVIPAVWTSSGIGEAVGCLNNAGLWTTDSANCGTFTGIATIDSGTVLSTVLSTSAGYCNIIFGGDIHDHLSYACGNPDANTATATEVRYIDYFTALKFLICV